MLILLLLTSVRTSSVTRIGQDQPGNFFESAEENSNVHHKYLNPRDDEEDWCGES